MSKIVQAENIFLSYKKGKPVIKDSSFFIESGDFIFVTGKSGSGKSTILKSLYGAITPYSGRLTVCGTEINSITTPQLNILRKHLGIVFQDYKLIKEWTIKKNVMLPLLISGYPKDVCETQTRKLLSHVKLTELTDRYPLELSGGEQQRAAVARAIVHNPVLIIADEPTGNLDEFSSEVVMNLLKGANQLGLTVIVATHQIPSTFGKEFRHIHIEDGSLYEIS